MTQKDFKVKNGIIASGNITSSNSGFVFDATANTLSVGGSLVALASTVNTVQSNVTSLTTSVNTIKANVDSVASNVNNILTGTTSFSGAKTFTGNLVISTLVANGSLGSAGQVLTSNASGTYWSTIDSAGSVNLVQSNLNTVSSNVNTISSNLNTISSNVNTVTTNLGTVSSNLNSLTTSVNTIRANVNSVQSNLTSYISTANLHTITSAGNVTTNSIQVGSIKAGTSEFTGSLTVTGNLYVTANSTFLISANNLSLEDNMIYLNANNKVANPDLGIAGNYNDGTYRHAGIFRDATDGVWKFYDGYLPEPDASPYIDTANTSFNLAGIGAGNINLTRGIAINGSYGTAGQVLLSNGTNSAWTTIANADVVQSNLTTLTTSVGTISSNVNTLTTNLGTVSSNVNTLTTNLGTVSSNVNTVTTNLGTVSSNVNTVTTNLGTVSSNLNSLTTSVNTIKANVDSVSSNVSSIISGSTAFTGNISAPRVILNTQLQIGSNATTSVGTSATTIFTFPGATYRGVDLTLLVQDVTNSQYQLSKMMVIHNGTAVDWTEYAMLSTNNNDLTVFTAAIDAGANVTIVSTGGSANKKITVSAQYIIQ
jgi:archaellum component FlaC